jgi:hypothetical protein
MLDAFGDIRSDRLDKLAFGVGHDGQRHDLAGCPHTDRLAHDGYEIGEQAEAHDGLGRRVCAEDPLHLGPIGRLVGVVDDRIQHLGSGRRERLLRWLDHGNDEGILLRQDRHGLPSA